jgi:hypothetical protein
MHVLDCDIVIGSKRIRYVNEVEVIKSAKVLEDTATIKIPTTARLTRAGQFISEVPSASAFAVGDEVQIWLGYDGILKEEFRGYVRTIKLTTPLSIECEDATYLLRKKHFNQSWKKVTLKEVLNYIVKGTGIEIATSKLPSITFHGFYLRNVNGAKALQELKDKYGLTIYFTQFKTLFVGLSYDTEDETRVRYEVGTNVIEHDLVLQDSQDVSMKVKVIGILPDGSRLETEVGDGAEPDKYDKKRKKKAGVKRATTEIDNADFSATGKDSDTETRTAFFYNIRTVAELQKLGLEELRKYKRTGFKGGLTTFLRPFCTVGNIAFVNDPFYPERGDGDYLIDKITTTFNTSGARRKVEIGLKVK